EVSDADTMLDYIAPNAEKPKDITVFTRPGCEFCARAKGMLNDAGLRFEELVLNQDYTEASLRAVAGQSTVPQVFINGEHIGGSEALEAYMAQAA
ncbi:glutaredoxin domain-containing protein, partial [Sedimenticola sp.]|uniref:glutaredoxin domain-containing protein n=1 Tax=Sedimenticola sp. TaxID=1940285 RepID=UPI0025833056